MDSNRSLTVVSGPPTPLICLAFSISGRAGEEVFWTSTLETLATA